MNKEFNFIIKSKGFGKTYKELLDVIDKLQDRINDLERKNDRLVTIAKSLSNNI